MTHSAAKPRDVRGYGLQAVDTRVRGKEIVMLVHDAPYLYYFLLLLPYITFTLTPYLTSTSLSYDPW